MMEDMKEGLERSREAKDMQALDMIYNAFESLIALLQLGEYDAMGLTPELSDEFEKLTGSSLEDIIKKFSSDACKGKEVYFYYDGHDEIRVSIGSREGVKSEKSGTVFTSSSKYCDRVS